jgi:probable rRNA maturation factor
MMIIEHSLSPVFVVADDTEGSDDEPRPSSIALLIAHDAWNALGDVEPMIRRAHHATAAKVAAVAGRDVAILLTSDDAIAALNAQYRGQDKPTNVLSFPAPALPPSIAFAEEEQPPLGDIAIAYETVMREAAREAKPPIFHLAHLTVHGLLHLAGFDHETDAEAEHMEATERDILASIGIPNPYPTSDEPPALTG